MREMTFVVALDGFRRDYLTPENAPFLHDLSKRSLTASMVPPPGFTPRTAMLTGAYPDTSNAFSAFGYDPERSPFRWVGKLGPVGHLYQPRKMFFPFRLAVKRVSQWTSGRSRVDPAWIPARYLPHFSVVEDRPIHEEGATIVPGIFDLLRAQGRSFKYLGRPAIASDDETHKLALATLRAREEHDLVFAQLSDLEETARHKGPLVPDGHAPAAAQTDADRELVRRAIRDVDRKCRELHEALAAGYERFHFIVVSEHGMAPVMQKVNVAAQVQATGLRPGRDHLLFVDSTLVRVWSLTERARQEIPALFEDVPYGRIITTAERRERRIPTDRKYGDLLFAADPGVLFWPDYFHAIEHDIKGMHGYVEKDGTWGAETTGVLMMDGPAIGAARDLGRRDLVDVFPTLCALAGLDVPSTNEGRSLLEDPHAVAP